MRLIRFSYQTRPYRSLADILMKSYDVAGFTFDEIDHQGLQNGIYFVLEVFLDLLF
jgi:hypothetical protein